MNVYSILASIYVLIVTVLSENRESKNETTTNDDCDANLSCEKCVQLKHCHFVHCYNDTKGLCTHNETAVGVQCDVLAIKGPKQCSEDVTAVPSVTTQRSSNTTAATVPVPSTRGGTGTGKGFSGPSFIGGIVLAFGLMAIAVVVFKFYKARTEANYHTL